MPFSNLLGLYALLSLVPFIIMYLIRSRPIEKIIPSLMFFLKEQKKAKHHAFFRRLVQNLLFYLQLAILLLLSFAVAEPYLKIPHDEAATNTVIIIDGSASMQALSGGSTRFQKAVEAAVAQLSGKVSIILATDVPQVMLHQGSNREARSVLSSIRAADSSTSIEPAMFQADALLGEEKGKIVVISDFVTTDERDQPIKAERILAAKGNSVQFVNIGDKASNLGIVDMDVGRKETMITLKNADTKKASLKLVAKQSGAVIGAKDVEVLPNSLEFVSFATPPGESTIEIDAKDSLPLDNLVYLVTPEKSKTSVLLITNERGSYLEYALSASDRINLEIRNPPVTKAYDLHHDIIIISNIKEVIIPPDVLYIQKAVENGTSLIIAAQPNLNDRNLNSLLPVRILERSGHTSVSIDIVNEITKNVEIGDVKQHLAAQALNSTITLATANDQSPILALQQGKAASIFYYGVIDSVSDFPKTHYSPLFWDNLISVLTQKEDITGLNMRIGDAGFLEYPKQGIYDIGGKRIALNLLNEKESTITSETDIFSRHEDFQVRSTISRQNYELAVPLLLAALAFLFLEIIYIKWRGDA